MQVSRHGTKWNDDFPKQEMCNKCKCVFLYDKKDIREHYHQHFPTPPAYMVELYFYCPECQNKINIGKRCE